MKRILFFILSALLFSNALNAQVLAESYVHGPMIGSVTDSVTPVIFLAKKGNESHYFHVAMRNVTTGTLLQASETKEFCMDDTCIFTFIFRDLTPGNRYHAVLYIDNIPFDSTRTDVRVPGSGHEDFSFIIGSGAKLYPQGTSYFAREQIYATMAQENVDFVLWLGDNIYLPYENLIDQTIYHQYLYYKTESSDRNDFLKHFFHWGIWDDHDYSYDNGNKDFFNKTFTSKMYKTFWPHSGYLSQSGNDDTRGIYRYEDCDFIMTDSRWYKTRYTNYGKEQMEWIKEQLLNSTATFKFLLLSTATLYPWYYSTPSHETSAWETGERDELLNFIYENNIPGVIILSGDKHKSYFAKYQPDCKASYPVYEFMSSAFTSTPNTSSYDYYADMLTQFSQNSYGVIEISGTQGNRTCTMTAKDIDGNIIYSISLNENELKESSSPDIDPNTRIIAKYDFAGNANDNSGNGYDATVNGPALSFDRWGNINNSYVFTSYPSTINFPNTILDGRNDFSISFWMKADTNDVGVLSAASSTLGNEILVYYGSTKKISLRIKDNPIYIVDSLQLHKWYNVTVTRNGTTGEARIYINGELKARGTLPTGAVEIVSGGLLIGNDQDGAGGGNLDENQQFKGILDDFVFYDTVLCEFQVKEIYEEGMMKVTAITNDTICTPGYANFIVSGAENGHYKWYKTKEGNSLINETDSVLNVYLTETHTYWVSADNGWTETKREPVTITVAPPIYTNLDSLTHPYGLSFWMPIEGSAEDVTGNFTNIAVSGPELTTGRLGETDGAFHFSDYPDIIQLPADILDGAEEITISFWMRTTSSSDGIFSAASSEAGNELLIYLLSGGNLQIVMNEKAREYTSPVVNDGLWHHIVFTAECKSGTGNLYVDGEKAVNANEYFLPGELEVPDGAFIIGNDQDTPGGGGLDPNQQYNGDLDDIKIYRRVLSEEEITDLFNEHFSYKTPFRFDISANQVCSGQSVNVIMTPVQANVEYVLTDGNSQPVSVGIVSGDTVNFEFNPQVSGNFYISAYNDYGCVNQFDTAIYIDVIQIATPEIAQNFDTLCATVWADSYSWFLNDSLLPYTQQCILATQSGDYRVIAHSSGCNSDTSDTYNFTLTNNENENYPEILIYPVPAKNKINVNSPETIQKIYVSDIYGKLLMEKEPNNNKAILDISSFGKGVYLLKAKTPNGFIIKRFEKID